MKLTLRSAYTLNYEQQPSTVMVWLDCEWNIQSRGEERLNTGVSFYETFSIHSSMALQPFCWTLAAFSFSYSYIQTAGLLGRGTRPSQGRYLHTGQNKLRINAHTDIHALIGIRTHDFSVRASEENSCLKPRGHCDCQLRYKVEDFTLIK
jgi:hypothetical protein